jgi:two-component system sensor histidine kinase KdpD
MDQEADRLMELIGQLLDVARLQAGTLRIKATRQTISDVIHNDAMSRLEVVTANHQLVLDIEKDIPPVDIDGSRIAQVLINLVDNAAKYSPAESTITLRAVERSHDVCISVSDQGIGIPNEEREHVFDIFRQLEGTKQNGAGLGLAICRSLIEAHHGHIWIEDAPAGGTKVSFTLPLPRQSMAQ